MSEKLHTLKLTTRELNMLTTILDWVDDRKITGGPIEESEYRRTIASIRVFNSLHAKSIGEK